MRKNETKDDSVDANLNDLVYSSLTSLQFQIKVYLNKNVLFPLKDNNSCTLLLSPANLTGWFGAKKKGSQVALLF
jgi:hypothetical protein